MTDSNGILWYGFQYLGIHQGHFPRAGRWGVVTNL